MIWKNAPWTLASSSPRRLMLLRQLGIEPIVRPANIPEHNGGENPAVIALANAARKADAVLATVSEGILLAADTLVVCDEIVLGKPADEKEAFKILTQLSGSWHEVVTGFVVCYVEQGLRSERSETTRVHFRNLSSAEIKAYINSGEPFDKAGGYGLQGLGSVFVDRIEGCYFNVVGLPLANLISTINPWFTHA